MFEKFTTRSNVTSLRAIAIATVLSAGALSPALALEPSLQTPGQHTGWGAGPIDVSLIGSAKKEAPLRAAEPQLSDLAAAPLTPRTPTGAAIPSAAMPGAAMAVSPAQAVVAYAGR